MATVLVISPTPTHPQDAGNRARIFSLLTALKTSGHSVHFAFITSEPGDETAMIEAWDNYDSIPYQRPADRWLKQQYDQWMRKLGRSDVMPYRVDDWYPEGLNSQLKKIAARVQPDVVLVEYVFLSMAFTCCGPEVMKILDTHDIFGDRHKLYSAHGHQPVFFYTTKKEEKKALDRADLVLAIQNEEAAYFKQLTQRKVITVGHMVQTSASVEQFKEHPNRLLFVGSANHVNMDGLNWFVETTFPRLRKAFPEIEMDVVGQSATKLSPQAGLNLLGPVAALAPHYQKAAVVINPLRFGTGLKIKTIEALAFGKPLVTTSIGAAGLEPTESETFLVADTPELFCEQIAKLLCSADLRTGLGIKAQNFVRQYNEETVAPLLQLIDKRLGSNR